MYRVTVAKGVANWGELDQRIAKGLLPPFRMSRHSQAEIDGSPYLSAGIAPFVVAREVVREHEVAATTSDFDAGPQLEGWVKQRRMPRALLEHTGTTLGEESLVLNM
jgi:hypothetical protein